MILGSGYLLERKAVRQFQDKSVSNVLGERQEECWKGNGKRLLDNNRELSHRLVPQHKFREKQPGKLLMPLETHDIRQRGKAPFLWLLLIPHTTIEQYCLALRALYTR